MRKYSMSAHVDAETPPAESQAVTKQDLLDVVRELQAQVPQPPQPVGEESSLDKIAKLEKIAADAANQIDNIYSLLAWIAILAAVVVLGVYIVKYLSKSKFLVKDGQNGERQVDKKHIPEETLSQIALNRDQISKVSHEVHTNAVNIQNHREEFKEFRDKNSKDHERVMERIDTLLMSLVGKKK